MPPKKGFALLGVLCAVVALASGCPAPIHQIPGTAAGTYTVTVTATPSSGTAQQTTISLNVQ